MLKVCVLVLLCAGMGVLEIVYVACLAAQILEIQHQVIDLDQRPRGYACFIYDPIG